MLQVITLRQGHLVDTPEEEGEHKQLIDLEVPERQAQNILVEMVFKAVMHDFCDVWSGIIDNNWA